MRWRLEEERAKEEAKAEAMTKEGFFEAVYSRDLIQTQRQVAKAKHDASIAKAKKALARGRKASKIGNQLRDMGEQNIVGIHEEWDNGSLLSELSSNKSY